jgi:hypothetical protein
MEGNLMEGQELLSLAWRDVGRGFGGRNGGLSRLRWLRLIEEEKEEICRGERKEKRESRDCCY